MWTKDSYLAGRLIGPTAFEEEVRVAQLVSFEHRTRTIRREHTSGEHIGNDFDARKTSRLDALKLKEKLWLPKNASFCVLGSSFLKKKWEI